MDEYNTGMDPEVRRYFKKIMNSFFVGLFWMLIMATAGIFFRLGYVGGGIAWYNIVFYLVFCLSLAALLRYYYKTWRQT